MNICLNLYVNAKGLHIFLGPLFSIFGTISAYESLTLRGYDVVAVVLEDHGLLNKG
ncbi:hypothetical protein HN51_031463 [Arachis hypogaea]